MAVKNYNFGAAMVLGELASHCWRAEYAFEQLNRHTGGWRDEKAEGSINSVFCYVTLLLTLSGTISSFLFGGGGRTSRERAARLRELMKLPDLPLLAGRQARNALVHIDERLDLLLSTPPGKPFATFWIAKEPPRHDVVYLKRLDPFSLVLWTVPAGTTADSFVEVSIDLRALMDEIRQVESAADPAMHVLHGERFVLWPDPSRSS
jgi:hypothetical protein